MKHLMMSRSEFESWLRRGRVAVVVVVGLILLVGAVFIVSKLIGAQFASVMIGLIAMLAGCVLGGVAWGALSLADHVFNQGEQLERQRERICQLEADLQLNEAEAEARVRASVALESALLRAEDTPEPTYPRIADARDESQAPAAIDTSPSESSTAELESLEVGPIESGAAEVESVAPANDELSDSKPSDEERFCAALAAGDIREAGTILRGLNGHLSADRKEELQARYDALRARIANKLRVEFAALLRAHDYPGALRKGDEIVAQLPASRMRSDFDVIRPHLEARVDRS